MEITVNTISEGFKVNYASAYGIIKVLAEMGLAVKVGTYKRKEKGRGEVLWRVPTQVALNFENYTALAMNTTQE